MQQAMTGYQWMVSGTKRLQAVVRRGGGVGGLIVLLLLLPLRVGAVGSGDLDPSFGRGGTVLTNFRSGSDNVVTALALQADGKIVVAGDSVASGRSAFALARYLPNGTLDASFSGDGKVLTNFGSDSWDQASALVLQADGKIVVAGDSVASGRSAFALARYLPNGTLDATFGGDGKVLTNFGSDSYDFANALALQADGKIVVAGGSSGAFALARYLPTGALDATFGYAGTVLTDFESGGVANALALQADGKIVVAGFSSGASGKSDFILARYLPTGALDATFGYAGTVLTDFGNDSTDYAEALALQADGKIVVAGSSIASDFAFALARYLPTGALDPSFGGAGTVLTNFSSGSWDMALALAIQPNGKIVVAGWSDASGNQDFALARYLPTGTLDASFGGAGKMTTDVGSTAGALALAIQPRDGRLVVAGVSDASGNQDFALARYHAITCNGVVATRVGTNGNDTLIGTAGPDVIVSFDGHDTIYGLGGNDLLCGNAGNDTLVGGSGDDTLVGETGTDVCDGGSQVRRDTTSGCEYVTGVP